MNIVTKEMIADAIKEHGIEAVQKAFVPDFLQMVAGSRLKKALGVGLVATGYDRYTAESWENGIETLLAAMPDGKEKDELLKAYDYFKANKSEVVSDHRIPS